MFNTFVVELDIMQNFFVKSHGLGNDYIVFNQTDIQFELTEKAIRKICDVHFGIGSDGILLKVPSIRAAFGLRILNPDGSEAEKSGNGLRIFAKYLYDYKFAKLTRFTIETAGGLVQAEITEEKNGKAHVIKVDMGQVSFTARDVPVKSTVKECIDQTLHLKSRDYVINCVSVGNPHCVIIVDELNEEEVKTFGPQIENHPMFPRRINVQFARIISPTEVEIMIWERGAGWTLASGSSACAVAAVMVKKELTGSNLTVMMQGGNLHIETDSDWHQKMTGSVMEIASGTLSRELIAEFL